MTDLPKIEVGKPFISVNLTPAMSGYFATLYTWSRGEGGIDIHGKPYPAYDFPEPEQTGLGRYPTWEQANFEGKFWAEQEGVMFIPATAERVAEAEARSSKFGAMAKRARELRDQGLSLRDALTQAKQEHGL